VAFFSYNWLGQIKPVYFLKNLGKCQGYFTHFSAFGEFQEDIPSFLHLEGLQDHSGFHINSKNR
jgi:hypothetical protein